MPGGDTRTQSQMKKSFGDRTVGVPPPRGQIGKGNKCEEKVTKGVNHYLEVVFVNNLIRFLVLLYCCLVCCGGMFRVRSNRTAQSPKNFFNLLIITPKNRKYTAEMEKL